VKFGCVQYNDRMEKDARERFERIEQVLEQIGTAHLELEAAQKNTSVALTRFINESNERGAKVDERISNLTILVDQLIKKDMDS
jgi:hypothetical protein